MNKTNTTPDHLLTHYLILIDLLLHQEILRLDARNRQAETWHASRGLFITEEKLNNLVKGWL